MISIQYTDKEIEGEPGPNLYWRGQPLDYLHLVVALHSLGSKNGGEIQLERLPFINLVGDLNLYLRSTQDALQLVKRSNSVIEINLDKSIWQRVLRIFLSVSFYPSHEYVDFDELRLVEDANLIISSEG